MDIENKDEPTSVGSSIYMTINNALEDALTDFVLTPQTGFQRIRKTLFRYRMDLPPVYELDPESDEQIYNIEDMETGEMANLYVIYSVNEDGYFEFYAEVGDTERMQSLMSDEDETETD